MKSATKIGHLLISTSLLMGANSAVCQDLHFSQIHASPVLINPAFTGLFNADYRFIANYKQQWRVATANFNTIASSFDGKVLVLPNKTFISAGVNAISDRAGDLNYSKNYGGISFSVLKAIDSRGNQYVSMGMENGIINHSVDFSKARGYEAEHEFLYSAEPNIYKWDISAGMAYYCSLYNKSLAYAGLSFYHINRPDISLNKNNTIPTDQLYRKLSFTAGAELFFFSGITVMPSVLIFDQGPHREITMGSYIKRGLHRGNEDRNQVYFGTWLRWAYVAGYKPDVDAAIFSMRLDLNGLTTAFSYDVNISTLARASKGDGGPEISLIYLIDANKKVKQHSWCTYNKNKGIPCPSF